MLLQILSNLGFSPTKETSNGYQYKSPFNPQERTPSFFVFKNSQSGEYTNFKDYSSGAGGDTYKFIMSYFHIDFKSAKNKISELIGSNIQEPNRPTQTKPPIFSFNQQKESKKNSEKQYKIKKVSTLTNKALENYLVERGLVTIDIHRKYISEIYYEMGDKNYFALSFVNDGGGREVRNKYFKGSFGKKDISLITPTPTDKRVKIFEGFMDFLSYLEINKNAPLSNYLILNSASLKERGLRAIQGKFEQLELYLDNDKRGDEATEFFMQNFSNAIDKRVHYKEHKDLNDFLLKGFEYD